MVKKTKPKKAAAKKKAAPKSINVFSPAFIKMLHAAAADDAPMFTIECAIDGNLKDDQGQVLAFSSLDDANAFAKQHRDTLGLNHKCIVKAKQAG